MKLTLKEMNGLLNGKCLPSDLIVGETLAEYLLRKFTELEQKLADSQREFRAADATIENLQMQVEKLAAENAGLREYRPQPSGAAMMEALDAFYEYHEDVPEQGMMAAFEILCCKRPETPATDAFLAEVRASAIDSLVDIKTKQLADMHPDTHAFGATAITIRTQINELQVFAAQLRKGVQS
ncbi:TPA: hypothetical protein ONC52_000985 [Enterobacter asburiae]|uniref:hypothetical protein n=1 Tax=Enterobacter asburiae TaxID=61645 RepID=UPI001A9322DE|nr:hypothetical protein [Enterobacter asburiae]BCT18499.1 hypothetical protein R2TS_16710 [Enterobacter asburiae]HCR1900852.1 hypothetical protein [Enterobacter asburiae]HCR2009196.1 hypothetical protein [Enterobacter asburiae]HCR2222243.1 hypothetical protein [Enterobacter asburiae]HDX3905145.1 hypothetical protein [Enterobacter asburiae]